MHLDTFLAFDIQSVQAFMLSKLTWMTAFQMLIVSYQSHGTQEKVDQMDKAEEMMRRLVESMKQQRTKRKKITLV